MKGLDYLKNWGYLKKKKRAIKEKWGSFHHKLWLKTLNSSSFSQEMK